MRIIITYTLFTFLAPSASHGFSLKSSPMSASGYVRKTKRVEAEDTISVFDNERSLRHSCNQFNLDFEGLANAGEYITDQFLKDYGVVIWADTEQGGYTPNAAARLFDTSNPGTYENGDPDLGSPNENCPTAGPGLGDGGVPEGNYTNCDELGLVLIIQEEDKDTPDDNKGGGKIIFDFEYPSNIDEIAILDIDDDATPEVEIIKASGRTKTFETSPTGENGLFKLPLDEPGAIRLIVHFPSSGAVARLSYSQCTKRTCPVDHLDFDELKPGEYVTDQLVDKHGVSVTAVAPGLGYTPDGAARIFDTSNPGIESNGDPDLGSPNENCPNPGPGVGDGGGPDSAYPNCDDLGMVLIVQEEDKDTPDDTVDGGWITFDFKLPSKVEELAILDIDEGSPVLIEFEHAFGGEVKSLYTETTGNNGLYLMKLNEFNVISLTVKFPGSGAVSHLDFMPMDCPRPVPRSIDDDDDDDPEEKFMCPDDEETDL